MLKHFQIKTIASLTLCLFSGLYATAQCNFIKSSMSFSGTPVEQANCLLREVRKLGIVSKASATLPPNLASLIGNHCDVSKQKLQSYLDQQHLLTADLGGKLSESLSMTSGGNSATYFVIHDMSTPELSGTQFPKNIDTDEWSYNKLNFVKSAKAHVYVGRTGKSKTMVAFDVPWRATKFELNKIGNPSKGLFLHIELLQPRIKLLGEGFFATAPEPGFTQEQYQKLALLYLCDSVRKGSWLIPCYHAALDEGLNDGHDDPQNFRLSAFDNALAELIQLVK